MADDKITFDTGSGHFPEGAYLRMAGGPWWKTRLRIVRVDSATTMTVRWMWSEEPWFQIPIYYAILWANFIVWSGWNESI